MRARDLLKFQLRLVRSLELLEHINNTDARALLQTLSDGAPRAWLTQEAKKILQCLTVND